MQYLNLSIFFSLFINLPKIILAFLNISQYRIILNLYMTLVSSESSQPLVSDILKNLFSIILKKRWIFLITKWWLHKYLILMPILIIFFFLSSAFLDSSYNEIICHVCTNELLSIFWLFSNVDTNILTCLFNLSSISSNERRRHSYY